MITQKKIAEHLGLGRSTVSNILRGDRTQRYDEVTRKLVLETAEELGYRPNRAARSIRMGRSNLVGVIHFGMGYEVSRQVAHYLPQAVAETGYEVFVADLGWHAGSYRRAVEQLVEARVEGVIIAHMTEGFTLEEVGILKRAGIPVAALAGNEMLGVPVVCGDSESATQEMVNHLVGLGHRRIVQLLNRYDSRPMRNRAAGFAKGIAACGGRLIAEHDPEPVTEWLRRPGRGLEGRLVRLEQEQGLFDSTIPAYRYVRGLIAANALPDAIVCANDQWAKGAFSAAFEAGLRVPEDFAVTGFDNESFSAYAPYYLTTAAQALDEECSKITEVIVDLIQGRSLSQKQFVYPCRVITRRSCGAEFTPAAIR